MSQDHSDFAAKVRAVLLQSETPLELGWTRLNNERRQRNIHITDKELFFAGASYLFDTMLYVLDPSSEPTEQDMLVMAKFHAELNLFNEHFTKKFK